MEIFRWQIKKTILQILKAIMLKLNWLKVLTIKRMTEFQRKSNKSFKIDKHESHIEKRSTVIYPLSTWTDY